MGHTWKNLIQKIAGGILLVFLVCGMSKEWTPGQEIVTNSTSEDALKQEAIGDCSQEIRKGILQAGGFLQDDPDASSAVFRTMQTQSELEALLLKSIKAHDTTLELREYHIQKDEFAVIYTRLINSHPELFYIDMENSSWRYYEVTGYMMDIRWAYYWDKKECEIKEQEYEAAIQRALRGVDTDWSDLEKALYINDYLCENITYDDSLTYFDAYHGLVEGTTVCQGYALAYNELAERMGLRSQMVTSEKLQHAWNMVEVDGRYYHVDATWNDNVYESGLSSHFYFLKSTKFFQTDSVGTATGHRAGDYLVQGDWNAGYAVYTDYDDCSIWNGVHSTFNYIDGYWYTFDDTAGDIVKYSYQKGTLVCRDKKSLRSYQLPGRALGNYSSLGDYDGKLYFAYGNVGIYQLDPNTDQVVLVYELPAGVKNKNGYAVYLNVDSFGRISYICTDGTTMQTMENVCCVDDNTYKVSYELYGGSLAAHTTKSYQSLSDTIVLAKPARAGYLFLGWYTGSDFKTKVTCIPKGSYGNKRLYAGWTKTYTITYQLAGGKNSRYNPKSYCRTTGTIVLRQPKRGGYKFQGWYKDQRYTKKITRITKGSKGNLTLYAKWTKKK